MDPIAVDASEAELLRRLQAGEDEAYAELVRTHVGRMMAVARRLLGNEDDARDAVQDAFASAFRTIQQFSGQARIGTWLYRIVVNAALMKLRVRRRQDEVPIESLLPRYLEDGHQARPAAPWPMDGSATAEGKENRELVRRSIEKLPEPYRVILTLRDIEGLDTAQAAEVLGIAESAAKTRLHRARQALRALLDAQFAGDSL